VKVIVAPAIPDPVSVFKVPLKLLPLLAGATTKVRVVGVGDVDGGGLVNPEDPEVTVFDEVRLHELPAVQFWSFTR